LIPRRWIVDGSAEPLTHSTDSTFSRHLMIAVRSRIDAAEVFNVPLSLSSSPQKRQQDIVVSAGLKERIGWF
jgi:hypothetical protein